jgi:hypothetical protein
MFKAVRWVDTVLYANYVCDVGLEGGGKMVINGGI